MKNLINSAGLSKAIAPHYNRTPESLRTVMADLVRQDVPTMLRLQVLLEQEVPAMRQLAIRTMGELARRFTREEMAAILAAFNGTLLNASQLAEPRTVLFQLEDAHNLDGGIAGYGADPEELIPKLRNLSAAQAYFLLREVVLFWANNDDLEKFLEKWK
jgi:hypothetical protein